MKLFAGIESLAVTDAKHCLITRLRSGDPLVVTELRQLVPAPRCQARVRVA